ncbi:GNAT family N-acetyltransferase [Aliikangiella coralliicola]|uniref:GNAT family N-acetyltransferase n=1 Tax=Aliikangiella coralliicola TaxID=2592383 RepID=A0A545UCF8_9GAMM|nr:GNAT family N-acetyltransferase [Aliikangiella coralliicola]TQV87146.1 GNAT family N-acetyltransferase [Aliikangiella coralliicola]
MMTKRSVINECDELRHLNKANISNLTQLWRLMGSRPLTIGNWRASTEWPHRCWLDWGESSASDLLIEENLSQLKKPMVIPLWEESDEVFTDIKQILTCSGFELLFEQTAMYLDLKEYHTRKHLAKKHQSVESNLEEQFIVREIDSAQDIEIWTNIAAKSFDYEIDTSSIHRAAANPEVKLLLAFVDKRPVATAMLFDTNSVIGVHQVGVLPDCRGKGIARKLMNQVVDMCIGMNGCYVTLQASVEGKGLYVSLGFREQFGIFNYVWWG